MGPGSADQGSPSSSLDSLRCSRGVGPRTQRGRAGADVNLKSGDGDTPAAVLFDGLLQVMHVAVEEPLSPTPHPVQEGCSSVEISQATNCCGNLQAACRGRFAMSDAEASRQRDILHVCEVVRHAIVATERMQICRQDPLSKARDQPAKR